MSRAGKLSGAVAKLWKQVAPDDAPQPRLQAVNLTRGMVLVNSLEVADRGAARRKGLLGREGLARGEGLWIVPCESVHTFRMKFAIDLVYLDRKKRIRKIRSNVPPGRLSACLTAHSVIELRAGTILETQTHVGDVLEIAPTGAAERNADAVVGQQ